MAVILGATVEAVVMCWNVAHLVESNTVVIRLAHLNLHTPPTVVTFVPIRAMGVLNALGRADIVYTCLKRSHNQDVWFLPPASRDSHRAALHWCSCPHSRLGRRRWDPPAKGGTWHMVILLRSFNLTFHQR